MDECRLYHQHHHHHHHHVEFPHPLVIVISLLDFLQHGSGGSGRVCRDNHGAIEITTAQIEKLDRITPNKRYRLPSGVGGTHGIGANAKKSAFFRCVRLVSTRYTQRWRSNTNWDPYPMANEIEADRGR